MTREDRLVLYLTSPRQDARTREGAVGLLHQPLDWELLFGRVVHHRLLPRFVRNLAALGPEGERLVPESLRRRLQQHLYPFVAHDLILHDEIRRVFSALARHHVEFQPLKGALLARTVYPEPQARFFRDIDVLVRHSCDFPRVRQLVRALGYEFVEAFNREENYVKRRADLEVVLEIHRSLSLFRWFEFPPLFAGIWESVEARELEEGMAVPVMGAEYMILVLLNHAVFHGTLELKDLYDAAQILAHASEFSWRTVWREIQPFPCALGIPLVLLDHLARSYWDSHLVPAGMLSRIRAVGTRRGIDWAALEAGIAHLKFPFPFHGGCGACKRKKWCLLDFVRKTKTPPHHRTIVGKLAHFANQQLIQFRLICVVVRRSAGWKYAWRCLCQLLRGLARVPYHVRGFQANLKGTARGH